MQVVVSGNKVTMGATSLRVEVSSNESSIAALQLLPGLLHGPAGMSITQIAVYPSLFHEVPSHETISAFLHNAAISFLAVSTLILHCPATLPHPKQCHTYES